MNTNQVVALGATLGAALSAGSTAAVVASSTAGLEWLLPTGVLLGCISAVVCAGLAKYQSMET